jgi:hypothetical protein
MVTGKSNSIHLVDEGASLPQQELQLFIEVHKHQLRLSLFAEESDLLVAVRNDQLQAQDTLEEIEQILKEQELISRDYSAVHIAFKSQKQCLVPNGFFQEENASELFQKVHGVKPNALGVKDCTEAKLKIIYEREPKLEQFFLTLYPNAQFHVSEALLVEALIHRNRFVQNPKLFIDVEENESRFYLLSKKGLIFCHAFPTSSDEDVLYHASNVAKQHDLDGQNLEAHISGPWKINSPGIQLFKKYFAYVSVNMGLEYVKLSKGLSALRKQEVMSLLNLVACES